MKSYTEIIKNALKDGGIYDAMLALQEEEGYLSENAINALAEEFDIPAARVYETASFYSMIRMRTRFVRIPAERRLKSCSAYPQAK